MDVLIRSAGGRFMNNAVTRPAMRLLKRALMGSAASSLVLSIIACPAFAEDLSFPSLLPAAGQIVGHQITGLRRGTAPHMNDHSAPINTSNFCIYTS